MKRFRLRYQSTDLEMPPGEFIIGRSSECNLALDDTLVSRRHAALTIDAGGAHVRDLGSRNGVSVNGKDIDGPTKLSHLDRIGIGGQEMLFIQIEETPRMAAATMNMQRCGECGAFADTAATECPNCSQPLSRALPTVEIALGDLNATLAPGTKTPLRLIAGIAKKALQMQRYAEAARILEPHLQRMQHGLREEPPKSPGDVDVSGLAEATGFALSLAEGLEETKWIDWVLETHQLAVVLLSGEDIERLHVIVRKVRYRNARLLREYADALRANAAGFSAGERFRLKRLEGLERVVSA